MTSTSTVTLAPAQLPTAPGAPPDPGEGPDGDPSVTDPAPATGPGSESPSDVDDPDHRRRRTRDRLLVTGLAVAAFALRLVNPRGLWLDEATSVRQAKLPLGQLLATLWREDVHPPLHHLVLWADVRLLGDSELAVRLPSTVLGALLVPLVFVVARDLVDRRTALIAATLCATAPLAVWYAQEARMYAQFMTLAMVGVWAQVRLLQGGWYDGEPGGRRGGRRWWVVLVLAGTGLVLTHWFAALHVAALHLVFLTVVYRRRRTEAGRRLRRSWLLAMGAQAVLLAPLVPLAVHQLLADRGSGVGLAAHRLAATASTTTTTAAGGPAMGAPRPSVYSLITNLEWGLFGYQSDEATRCLVASWPLALLGVLLLLGRPRRSANRYLAFVAGLPTLAVFAASFLVSDRCSLAEVRYFAGAVPILFILVASVMTGVATTRRAQLVAAGLAAAVMVVALVGQHVSRTNPRRYGYREALDQVAAEARPGDRLVYTPSLLDDVLVYYAPDMPWQPLDDGLLAASRRGRIFLLTSSSFAESAEGAAQARRATERLQEDHRRMIREMRHPQVTVRVFR